MKIPLLLFLLGTVFVLSAGAQNSPDGKYRDLAVKATCPDPEVATEAIAELRNSGPEGLDALFSIRAEAVKALKTGEMGNDLSRLRTAIEKVSGQRDCHFSHLYWFTDLDAAQSAARASGKPILSLRLLGRLDEEFSCANSRYFRTTLYANEEISSFLRDHFILHWKSVRPVPKITIDFGDGRVVQQTITGNSIHYALSADGTVIDALPGLNSPSAFLSWLKKTDRVALENEKLSPRAREKFLAQYHAECERLDAVDFSKDMRAIGAEPVGLKLDPKPPGTKPPTALAAAARAVSKGVAEVKILRASRTPSEDDLKSTSTSNDPYGAATDAQWSKIAALHFSGSRLDPQSIALIHEKSTAPAPIPTARVPMKLDDPLLRILQNLQRSISEDTVRNEYALHVRLHQWLADAPLQSVESLNRRVYSELFLTPDSDPWLGLIQPDTFTALENNGRVAK